MFLYFFLSAFQITIVNKRTAFKLFSIPKILCSYIIAKSDIWTHFRFQIISILYTKRNSRKFFYTKKSFFNDTFCCLTLRCRTSSLHAKWVSWVYQSGDKYKNVENQIMDIFMDVSIREQIIKIWKIFFLPQKSVKITKAHLI